MRTCTRAPGGASGLGPERVLDANEAQPVRPYADRVDAEHDHAHVPKRSALAAVVQVVHITALAVWLAGVMAAGVVAATAFPTLRTLGVRVPEYAAPGEVHYLVAAGSVARRVFFLADAVSFVSSIVAVGTLLILVTLLGTPRNRPATLVRALALGVALASLASMLLIVTPRLDRATTAHWSAMRAGDAAAMTTHKAEVDEVHPIASRLVSVMAGGVLVGLVAGAWSMARPWRDGGSLETPLLARGRGL